MKRKLIVGAALALLLSLGAHADDSLEKVLWRDLGQAHVDSYPAWVPEELAFDEEGHLSSAYFPRELVDAMTVAEERRGRGELLVCGEEIESRPYYALADAVAASDWVVIAKVVSAKEGFLFSNPGTLMEAKVETLVKSPDGESLDSFLLFYPVADMRTPHFNFCVSPPSGGIVPTIGDEAIVMGIGQFQTTEGHLVLRPSPQHDIFWSRPGKPLVKPRLLKDVADLRKACDVRARVQKGLEARQERD